MNIVFLSARYPPDTLGGGELSAAAIAEGLVEAGHAVTVLAGASESRTEELRGVRVRREQRLHRLWAKPLLEQRTSAALQAVVRELLPEGSDVVHAHEFRSALALSLLQHPCRVVTVRDFAPICGTTNNMWYDGRSCDGCFWPNVLLRCHRVAEASLARKPFRVWQYKYNLGFRTDAFESIPHHIYISQSLKERIATRLHVSAAAAVIPNPVGPEWLSAPSAAAATAPIVTFAGTVESHKGMQPLLKALALVLRSEPSARLVVIGAGDIDSYRALAQRLGIASRVQFSGKLPPDKVRMVFDSSRVVVQPSIWEEPFGRTVIEAYARGRPVVASDIGGLKETVTSQTGIRVPPNDPPALAAALLRFLRHPLEAETFGAAGRAYVEQRYSAARIAGLHERFYASVQSAKTLDKNRGT